ncbi:MAG: ATP-binding protein [Candidatus Gracilibacteria bacterium]|nr:ATP-binding protein [Candidatus Gracilibacteria bacterium]
MLIGPRQVGKTTLVETLVSEVSTSEVIRFNGDYPADRRYLQIDSSTQADLIFSSYRYIIIDEAQKVPDIGNILKILADRYKSTKQVIVTGSSTLGLLDQTSEPLTGRKQVYNLYPIAFEEIVSTFGIRDAETLLESVLTYGSYPQVLSFPDAESKIRKLQDLVSGQLYRDILEFQEIKNPDVLSKLLEMLALQIGSEISYHSLARELGISQQTVEKYIDLLEKSFVIFRLRPYMTNKKKEITKMKKIYFFDLGIRNALLRNFNPLSLRSDTGALWENYFILERRKIISYHELGFEQRFWRTKAQEEVDYLEVGAKIENVFECRWKDQKYRAPKAFTGEYPDTEVQLVHSGNYKNFLVFTKK